MLQLDTDVSLAGFTMRASASPYPRVTKFLLCIDLRLGLLCYVGFEMMVWLFFSATAVLNEAEFLQNYDLYKFEVIKESDHEIVQTKRNFTDKFKDGITDDLTNWYYQMMFGLPAEDDYDYEEGCKI